MPEKIVQISKVTSNRQVTVPVEIMEAGYKMYEGEEALKNAYLDAIDSLNLSNRQSHPQFKSPSFHYFS